MEGFDALLSLIGGSALRIGFPIGVTALAVWLLSRLDRRWKKEAGESGLMQVTAKNPGCWDINNCSPEKRAKCKAFQNQEVPCWQLFRENDGNLRENCLGCDVFIKAPIPVSS